MADRRAGLRVAIALVAGTVLLIEVQSLVFALRHQTVLQRHTIEQAGRGYQVVRRQVEAAMAPGGPGAWYDAARIVLEAGLAAEVDFVDPASGQIRLSLPSAAPTVHWPDAEGLRSLRSGGGPLVVGPLLKPAPRVLTYVYFPASQEPVVMRLAANVSTLADDLRERRPLLVGQALAIALLVALLGLALLPRGEDRVARAPGLGAYEEAMGRLRDRGEAKDREHAEEKRRMEGVLRDKEAMARAGELTAGIVHEVRNGLGTIVGYARLAEKGATTSASAEAARGILAECATLETVARRFMDFVRDETLNLAPVDLVRLVERVAAREARGRARDLRLEASSGLPALAGDETMLERAFENVIRNALEAAGPSGQIGVQVEGPLEGRLFVRVVDDGPGLAAGFDVPRPFQTTKAGGLGLGLPMAVKIVALHGGDIRLLGRSPRGVEVVIRLPVGGPPE